MDMQNNPKCCWCEAFVVSPPPLVAVSRESSQQRVRVCAEPIQSFVQLLVYLTTLPDFLRGHSCIARCRIEKYINWDRGHFLDGIKKVKFQIHVLKLFLTTFWQHILTGRPFPPEMLIVSNSAPIEKH